jgi:hypothetical protein
LAEEYVISVVLEGNASSMTGAQNKVTKGNEKMTNSTTKANVAFLANIAVFQASVAALNQVSGGLNKTAGALDKLGAKDTAAFVRKIATAFEIVAGPLEVILAGFTFYVILSSQAAAGAIGFSLANFTLAGSLVAVKTAMLGVLSTVGPFILVAGVVYLLAKNFDIFGDALDALLNPLQILKNLLEGIAEAVEFVESGFSKLGSTFSDLSGGIFNSPTALIKGGA